MNPKQPHFSLQSVTPYLESLQGSVSKMIESAGGEQAILADALQILERAGTSQNVPLALLEQVFGLLAEAMKAQAAAKA